MYDTLIPITWVRFLYNIDLKKKPGEIIFLTELAHSWYDYWSPGPRLPDLCTRTQVSKALLSTLNRTESRKQPPEKVCIVRQVDVKVVPQTSLHNCVTKVFWCRDSCGGARSTSPSSTSTSPSWSCSATPSGNQPQYYLANDWHKAGVTQPFPFLPKWAMPLNPVTSHLS